MELNSSAPDFSHIKRKFGGFLDNDHHEGQYAKMVEKMLEHNETRLVVNINDLRKFDGEDEEPHANEDNLGDRLLNDPMAVLPPFEEALKDFILHHPNVELEKQKPQIAYRVGVEGSFGSHLVAPRDLNASLLTRLVCIEGIVTKLSLVRPKLVRSVHYCDATDKFSSATYRDATSFTGPPTGSIMRKQDDVGNNLTTEFGLSIYTNYQKLFIQDMPERSAAGQMPRTVEAILEGDLVDCCKPGDRVQVIGVYRALAHRAEGTTSGMYRTVCIVNHVRTSGQMSLDKVLTESDIVNIRKIAKRKDVMDLFSRSLASSLYGHEYIKKALLLLLLGGVEKNLENGTHLRGDINMLLVGDPSVGKSQLLRCVMHIAKLAISTTGRGATGVGLTAAVVQDKDSGERYLEAGAMVLGDRGIVCIDEFDKMSVVDRTAMHEVMEQQTVTIAKAGIHCSLNARCSVVAAANPIYGSYDTTKTPQKNIPLPDSILSRFDFLFVVLDKLDPTLDRRVADHVLRMHRYKSKENAGDSHDNFENDDADKEQQGDTAIFQKHDRFLHGSSEGKRRQQYLTLDFIKKYIDYAKKRYQPLLTDEATEFIANAYGDLRTKEEVQTLPITARCLETMIRLSSAHAKLRLSKKVTQSDVEKSLEILQFALNNEAQVATQRSSKKSQRSNDDSDSSDSDDESGDDRKHDDVKMADVDDTKDDFSPKKRKRRDKSPTPAGSPMRQPSKKKRIEETPPTSPSKGDAMDTSSSAVSKARKTAVMKTISSIRKKTRKDDMQFDTLFEEINKETEEKFTGEELEAILKVLEGDNRLMFRKGSIRLF